MTSSKLRYAAALLAAGLIVSLSVGALADGQEPDHDPRVEVDVEEIHARAGRALEAVPWDELRRALVDVRGILDGVDTEGIRAEVEAAMAELDVEEIQAEIREAFEDVDWDEIRRDIEAAHAEIETLDLEGVRADVLEAFEGIDWDEIRRTLEHAEGVTAEELEKLVEELGIGDGGVI